MRAARWCCAARTADFTLANFLRAQLYATMATLRIGMDLLALGAGGHRFADRPRRPVQDAGRRRSATWPRPASAPVTCMETAGEGGPYGMALLAAFVLQGGGETLENFLTRHVFADACPHDAPAGPGGR